MSFNLLTDPLPDSVEINGTDYLINPDHGTIIRILLILEDTTFYDEERRQMALFLFYKQALEDDVIAFEAMMDFIRCYKDEKKAKEAEKIAFDFEIDSDSIFSAFFQVYAIDLTEVKLHWFKFMALFADLNDGTPALINLMQIRTAELTSDMSNDQKLRLLALQKEYQIKKGEDPLSYNAGLADQMMRGG